MIFLNTPEVKETVKFGVWILKVYFYSKIILGTVVIGGMLYLGIRYRRHIKDWIKLVLNM